MRGTLALVAVLAVLTATGCGGGEEAAQDSLDVGYAFGADVGDVGDRLAFRELARQSGIRARYRDMGGSSQAVVGLTRGDIELAQFGYRQLLDAISAGAPVRAVLGSNMVAEFVLVGGPGISSVADLRGKRVAASTPGGGGDELIGEALEAAGMTREDAQVVYIDESPSRAGALVAGRIDAAALDYVEFELLRGRDPRRYTMLDRAVDRFPRIPQQIWAVDEGWAEDHEDTLREVVSGLLAGYEGVYTPAGRRAWIAEARRLFLKGEDAGAAVPVYAFYRDASYWPRTETRVTEQQHDDAVRRWMASRQIERPAAFGESWYPGYWVEAAGG